MMQMNVDVTMLVGVLLLPAVALALAYSSSIGKLLLGLLVIDLETGWVSSLSGSIRRNLLLLLPGANVVAIFLEARTIIIDPQGQRLGDRLAQTQVVEGAGARDLVKSFQKWLLSLGSGLGHAAGGRRRLPGRIDRAA